MCYTNEQVKVCIFASMLHVYYPNSIATGATISRKHYDVWGTGDKSRMNFKKRVL